MREKLLIKMSLCCCGLLAVMDPAVADRKAREFYYQQNQQRFIVPPQDARMLSMGGSTMLTTANAVTTVTNPAGLGRMRYGDLSVSYSDNTVSGHTFPDGASVEANQNIGQVYGAFPLGPREDELPEFGNLGLGWFGRDGDWDGDRADPITGENSDAYQVSMGYGAAVGDDATWGYSLTFQDDTLESRTHDYESVAQFRHNVGFQYFDTRDTVWGGSLAIGHGRHDLRHNLDTRRGQSVDQLDVTVGGGVEHTMDLLTLSAMIDYTHYRNDGNNDPAINDVEWGGDSHANTMNARIGLEHRTTEWMALRLGYRYASNFKWDYAREDLRELSGSAKYNAYSAGVGLNYRPEGDNFITAIMLDYGVEFRDVGDNDWQHYVTLSTPFDLCV